MKKILLFLLMVFWAQGVWATNYCSTSQACWTFPEGSGTTTADQSPNGNTGSFASSGHPAWSSSTVPSYNVSGSAAFSTAFSSSSDIITVTHAASINNPGPLTIVAWVNPTGSGGGNLGRILDKTGGTSTLGYIFYITGGTTQLGFQDNYSTTNLLIKGQNNLTLSTWTFVAVTWDGTTSSSGVHIYYNNVEISYASQQSAVGTRGDDSSTNLTIGDNAAGTRNWAGNISNVIIFNSVLSSTDLTSLYNLGPQNISTSHFDTVQGNSIIRGNSILN